MAASYPNKQATESNILVFSCSILRGKDYKQKYNKSYNMIIKNESVSTVNFKKR